MSKIKFYQYKKCSTCVKAKKYLEQRGVSYDDIDITLTPPTKAELKSMLAHYDGDIKKLFNTSGVQYRELNIKDKIKTMTIAQAIDLLASEGRLVKRPFLLMGKGGRVGFREEQWQELF